MEYWNRGKMGLKKTEHEAPIHAQVFCFLCPIFQRSTFPSFQAAYQEDDRKTTIIPWIVEIPTR